MHPGSPPIYGLYGDVPGTCFFPGAQKGIQLKKFFLYEIEFDIIFPNNKWTFPQSFTTIASNPNKL